MLRACLSTRSAHGDVTHGTLVQAGWGLYDGLRPFSLMRRGVPSARGAAATNRLPIDGGIFIGGRCHGPYCRTAGTQGRIRPVALSRGNPSVPDAGAAGGVCPREELARTR